jgi:hypothetical protein
MPYPVTLGRPAQRVTIEESPVAVVDAAAPVLTAPNRIGDADWRGWVQERSTYMPQSADPRYRTAVAARRSGRAGQPARHPRRAAGAGHLRVHTLALFRQLPGRRARGRAPRRQPARGARRAGRAGGRRGGAVSRAARPAHRR